MLCTRIDYEFSDSGSIGRSKEEDSEEKRYEAWHKKRDDEMEIEDSDVSISSSNNSERKRRRSGEKDSCGEDEKQREIQRHYDRQAKETRRERKKSRVINLRRANNLVKSKLIDAALDSIVAKKREETKKREADSGAKQKGEGDQEKVYVLDLGCGKGGDLPKWFAAAKRLGCFVYYFGIDISPGAIQELEKRYGETKHKSKQFLSVEAVVGDFCAAKCLDFPPDWPVVDIVSAQFSLHYGFSSVATCRALFDNIGRFLDTDHGKLICTLVDSDCLKQRLVQEGRPFSASSARSAFLSSSSLGAAVEFGNSLYSVCVGEEDLRRLVSNNSSGSGEGEGVVRQGGKGTEAVGYTFTLDSCVDGCKEYLVEMSVFKQMAAHLGLYCVLCRNFSATDSLQTIDLSADEYQVFSLYRAVAFSRKTR